MINRLFARPALHEHLDPAQRILGVAELTPDSTELAQLVAADPVPEVRRAAVERCADLAALAAAWHAETDGVVRAALATSLSGVLAAAPDVAAARAFLEADHCTDAIRGEVARVAADSERRRIAIACLRDESALVELALAAGQAETRMAAAERVQTPEILRRLADAAKNRDHGVARLARQRIDAIDDRRAQGDKADAILAELEALAEKPGPILTAVVELNRRWQALDMTGDAARLARGDAARQNLQARFDREHDEQRTRARFERSVREWLTALGPPDTPDALAAQRAGLAALRSEAAGSGDDSALSRLDEAEAKMLLWEHELQAVADAEALVVEAEQLAAGTSIDHAKLPDRWQAVDRTHRTPALTRRFEAALMVIEQRRLAQIQAAQQEASAARQRVHGLLHDAEQALAAGQLAPARAAADEIRARKADAGLLPKPTAQRLSRLVQQLTELERWESFGQQNARVQLCERADALAAATADAAHLAQEVQKLRNEWKTLDQQHAGVPKALWERFDRACEKAYAPAARHFAEVAARRKQARKQREEFIAAAAAHGPALLAEPRDWRVIERWLRDTDHAWREGNLGSLEPDTWKKLDARLKTALAPLRNALGEARDQAKAARQRLIDEATAVGARALERDAPSQVKAIQAQWQEQAKLMALAQRDERALWEQFRAACDAVFTARDAKRREADGRKSENRRALEAICVQLEQLAHSADKDDQELRRALRDLQEQWKMASGGPEPGMAGIESRFRSAKSTVEAALSARARSREAAVWQTLAAKERLCEGLDAAVQSSGASGDAAASSNAASDAAAARVAATHEQWSALPALPAAWEQRLAARRDDALAALAEPAAVAPYLARIERGAGSRGALLLELEMALGLESPPELQAQRLALQVQQLRDRFQSAAKTVSSTPGERLLAWCAEPGIADARERTRIVGVVAAIERVR